MRRTYVAALAAVALAAPASRASAQEISAEPRAAAIAEAFTKDQQASIRTGPAAARSTKPKPRTVPVVLDDAMDYVGTYTDARYGVTIDLRADGDKLAGSGTEPTSKWPRKFTLDRINIEGGLLTARKRYDDGSTVMFEAAFLQRVEGDAASTTPTQYGLGTNSIGSEKLFYEKQ